MPDLSRFDTTNNTNLASCLFAIIIGNGIINLASDLHYPPTRLSQRVLQGTTRALWTVPIIISTHFSQQSDFCDRNVIFALSFYVLGSVVIFALVAACTRLLNGIPGPTFAKLSILWKLTHAYRRTYDAAVRNLHDLHGAIVQVGPYEYSISDSSLFERCAQLQKANPRRASGVRSEDSLRQSIKMANVFYYESAIHKSTCVLLETMVGYAATGETIDMANLIFRYSYDVLFATTTGAQPGFLHRPASATRVEATVENWKFLSMLNGSHLRFHPILSRAARFFDPRTSMERRLSQYLEVPANAAVLEACAAIVVAGSDPIITHLLTSLYYIYKDDDLLERLRKEFKRAEVDSDVSFKTLIHRKPEMPILSAILQESLRLHTSDTSAMTVVAPEGGFVAGDKRVPQDCTICLEPLGSLANLNPDSFGPNAGDFDPQRWLQHAKVVQRMKGHMIAFGASSTTQCPGQDLHKAIISKTLISIIQQLDLTIMASTDSNGSAVPGTFTDINKSFKVVVSLPKSYQPSFVLSSPLRATAPAFEPETNSAPLFPPGFTPSTATFDIKTTDISCVAHCVTSLKSGRDSSPGVSTNSDDDSSSTVSTSSAPRNWNVTPATFGAVDKLEEFLGRETTTDLLRRFDPSQPLTPGRSVKSMPIHNAYRRAKVHEAIDSIWKGELSHVSDAKHVMYFESTASRNLRERRENTNTRQDSRGQLRGPGPSAKRGAAAAPRQVDATWSAFVTDNHVKNAAAAARFKLDREKAANATPEERERALAAIKPDVVRETFKLRKAPVQVKAATDDVLKPAGSALPPHLRAKLVARSVDTASSASTATPTIVATGDEKAPAVFNAAKLPGF